MQRLQNAVSHHIIVPFQELKVSELIVSIIAGFLGGIFPVPMLTSIATLLICSVLKCRPLEVGLATAINLLVTPIELFLIAPFARIMSAIIGTDSTRFTATALYGSTQLGFLMFLKSSASMLIHSFILWLAITIPFIYIIRKVLRSEHFSKDS